MPCNLCCWVSKPFTFAWFFCLHFVSRWELKQVIPPKDLVSPSRSDSLCELSREKRWESRGLGTAAFSVRFSVEKVGTEERGIWGLQDESDPWESFVDCQRSQIQWLLASGFSCLTSLRGCLPHGFCFKTCLYGIKDKNHNFCIWTGNFYFFHHMNRTECLLCVKPRADCWGYSDE